jgi:hypothetical protein
MTHRTTRPVGRATNQGKSPEAAWSKARRAVDRITDGLGKTVDSGIRDVVTALQVYKFPTTGSCEGHLNWGLTYPWIEVGAPHPDAWKEGEARVEARRRKNLAHQERLLDLLSQFYQDRNTPFDARLQLAKQAFGAFRLQNVGAEPLVLHSARERRGKLDLYQREMADFGAFLRYRRAARIVARRPR